VTLRPGSTLRLNCSSDLVPPVEWTFTAEGSNSPVELTSLGGVVPAFASRFVIDGTYDLVALTPANEPYCGTYKCSESSASPQSSAVTVASKFT